MHKSMCRPNEHSFAEDVQIAVCLKALKVSPQDTREIDKASASFHSEFFHPLTPQQTLDYRPGAWGKSDWFVKYTQPYDLHVGKQCCSPYSVSFHYLSKDAMLQLERLLHEECRKPRLVHWALGLQRRLPSKIMAVADAGAGRPVDG